MSEKTRREELEIFTEDFQERLRKSYEELENRKDKENILKTENISKKYLKKNEKPENINISLVTLKNNFIIGWSFL
jgi:hypothetical protein